MATDAELTGLIVKIKGDLTDYQAKLDAMQSATAKASTDVASKFDIMSASMAKAGVAMGAFAATAITSAMNWGSAVNKLAKQTGMGADEASKFLVVAKRVGIDTDTASMMFAKLAKSINTSTKEQSTANAEGKKATDVFTQLGVKTIDANGHMRQSSDIFADVKTQLAGMQNGWQKTAIEMEIFGKTGYQLNGLINMTSAEMKDAIDMAQSLGLILDDQTAPAWAKLSKEINAAKGLLSSAGITIGNELMPIIKEGINDVTTLAKAFSGMNPEVRSSIIEVVKLGAEIGIACTVINRTIGVIGGVTEALGIMKAATIGAVGPWITLAVVIGYAIDALYKWDLANNAHDRSIQQNRRSAGMQSTMNQRTNPSYVPGSGIVTYDEKPVYVPLAGMGDFDKHADEVEVNRLTAPKPNIPNIPNTDPFIGGDPNAHAPAGAKGKTNLQKYLEQLKDVEDILNRQVEFGEKTKEQEQTVLQTQLAGLQAVSVGQDEQLDKERAIYDLKSKLRQNERDQIDIAQAKSDRDFSAQTITETQYFEQHKKQLQDKIKLEAESSAKRYADEKALADFIKSNDEKQLARTLAQINANQALATAKLKNVSEQNRHSQAMGRISNLQGDTKDSLQAAKDAEQAIVDAQYGIDLKAINLDINTYTEAGEKKSAELKKALADRENLTQKYDNDILVLDDNLAEKQKELEQKKIDTNNQTIAALIEGTKSGHDILKEMWFKFVDEIVAKMFSIGGSTNVFDMLFGGLLGGKSGGGGSSSNWVDTNVGVRAAGGPVNADQPYIVGEQRPELFIPRTSGTIIPNLNMLHSLGNSSNNSSNTSNGGDTYHNYSANFNPTFVSPDPAANMKQFKQQMPMYRAEMIKLFKTDPGVRNAMNKAVTTK